MDRSFGTGGVVTTDLGGADDARDVVVQADGRIVVALTAGSYSGRTSTDFALVRYTHRGRLDRTFGTGGTVTTDFSGGTDTASALIVQPDGKLVVAGTTYRDGATDADFALARYTRDGRLDPAFGTGGKVTTDHRRLEVATALALAPDGKLVITGLADEGEQPSEFAVARYDADGTLDASFGPHGGVETADPGGEANVATAVVVQPDGRVVVAGRTDIRRASNFALLRYTATGYLDSTFGSGGVVVTDFLGSGDFADALVLQDNGKLVAAGTVGSDDTFLTDFGLARYLPDGTLDPAFGTNGKVATELGDVLDAAYGLVIQSDGKLVAVGSSLDHLALARYLPDGRLDPRFGTRGIVLTDIGSSEQALAVAIQPDGNLVVAGVVLDPSTDGTDMFVARYRTGRHGPR